MCNNANFALNNVNFNSGSQGYFTPFAAESAKVSISACVGSLIECTMGDAAAVTSVNSSNLLIGLYAYVAGTMTISNVPNVALYNGYLYFYDGVGLNSNNSISNTRVITGFFLLDNSAITVVNSFVGLFPSLTSSANIAGVAASPTQAVTHSFSMGSIRISLVNSQLFALNLYGSGSPVQTYRVTNSILGEAS